MSESLPESVLSLVEMSAVEDLVQTLLTPLLAPVRVQTAFEADQDFPCVVIRSAGSYGAWDGDTRFLDSATLNVDCLCHGLDADTDANLLAEAVRVGLRNSLNVVTPYGYLTGVRMNDRPKRAPDWANSVGPVQYADLPEGVERWTTSYRLKIRKPAASPYGP
jgi:hypothetical protein